MNQFLSREEVDALLRGITKGEVVTEQSAGENDDKICSCDLTDQERIIQGRLPTLEIINQKFARLLRVSLSGNLRRVIDVRAQNVEMSKFGEFLKTLPVPTSMHIMRLNPLRGGALLVIESKLVFALIDSFFGGPGNAQVRVEGRDFTPIETHVILRVADLICSDMQKAWEFVEPVTVELERSEVNPQCVGIVPPSAVVVLTPFAVQMDAAHGRLIFCLPYSTLEPIRSKLYAGFQPERLAVDQSWRRRIVHQLENLEVEMSVEFGSAEIHLRSLLGLQVGDIIRLDQDCDQPLVVRVEGVPKFTGLARVVKQKKAVEIVTRLYSQTEEEPNE